MTSRREEHEAYLEKILSNSLSSANPSKETYERLKKYYKKVSNPEEKPKGDGNVKG